MLARKFTLTDSNDFSLVQSKGKVYQSDNFGIAYLKRDDELPSKFGFIISTKIAKDAVDRNRIKRAMSEAVRINSVNLNTGFNAVFLAKTTLSRISTADIMKEVRLSLKEAGLLK